MTDTMALAMPNRIPMAELVQLQHTLAVEGVGLRRTLVAARHDGDGVVILQALAALGHNARQHAIATDERLRRKAWGIED